MHTGSGLQQSGSGRHWKMSSQPHSSPRCTALATRGEVFGSFGFWPGSAARTIDVKLQINNPTAAALLIRQDDMFQLRTRVLRWKIRLFTI